MEERDYWLAFSQVRGLGMVRFRKLLAHFGSLTEAWSASPLAFSSAGLNKKVIEQILAVRSRLEVESLQADLASKHISFLIWKDAAYPKSLLQIEQPPPVLYYRGTLLEEDHLAVAIVGTRNMTSYGRQLTKDTAEYLAGNGVTIVSGLARGVDAIAHQAALDVGGRTFAVLGSGVDVIYPPEHRQLSENILRNGAILSDYAPGTQPDGINFPPRNRIISGLSLATVVIEAGEKSGALITARFALEQGREVFAVPGSVLSPMSRGTNGLLASGATPMTNPTQVLEFLRLPRSERVPAAEELVLDEDESRILHLLGQDSLHIDEICHRLDLSIEKLTVQLTMMELKGLVERENGMEYHAVQRWDHP